MGLSSPPRSSGGSWGREEPLNTRHDGRRQSGVTRKSTLKRWYARPRGMAITLLFYLCVWRAPPHPASPIRSLLVLPSSYFPLTCLSFSSLLLMALCSLTPVWQPSLILSHSSSLLVFHPHLFHLLALSFPSLLLVAQIPHPFCSSFISISSASPWLLLFLSAIFEFNPSLPFLSPFRSLSFSFYPFLHSTL